MGVWPLYQLNWDLLDDTKHVYVLCICDELFSCVQSLGELYGVLRWVRGKERNSWGAEWGVNLWFTGMRRLRCRWYLSRKFGVLEDVRCFSSVQKILSYWFRSPNVLRDVLCSFSRRSSLIKSEYLLFFKKGHPFGLGSHFAEKHSLFLWRIIMSLVRTSWHQPYNWDPFNVFFLVCCLSFRLVELVSQSD